MMKQANEGKRKVRGEALPKVHPAARPHVMEVRFRRHNWFVDEQSIRNLCRIVGGVR